MSAPQAPVLTIEQRKQIAAILARRAILLIEVRRARRAFEQAEKYLQNIRDRLSELPTDRQLQKTYGVGNETLRRAATRKYRTLNPLDAKAAEGRECAAAG
jgi:hypothetical protein